MYTLKAYFYMFLCPIEPASVAHSVVCLTGDQEVTGSFHAGSGNILQLRWSMKSLPSTNSRMAVISFW